MDRLVWSPWSPRDFQECSPAPQVKSIDSSVLSLLYGPNLTSIHDYWKNPSFDYMNICQQSDVSPFFNTLSRFVTAFIPRSKCLLISWLQSPSTVILEPKKIKSVTAFTLPPSLFHEVMALDAMVLIFWILIFKPVFFFTLLFHPHQETL